MNTSLKLSIGMGEDPAALSPHSYTRLSLHVECHKPKVPPLIFRSRSFSRTCARKPASIASPPSSSMSPSPPRTSSCPSISRPKMTRTRITSK